MYIESSASLGFLMIVLCVISIAMLFVGLRLLICKKRRIAGGLIFLIGILLLFILLQINVDIPKDSIGIDQNGNWYSPGPQTSFEKIEIVPLKGSIPLWKEDLSLSYDLTPEEVMSLERGSNFQERLKSMYVYSIDENWNATMTRTSDVPTGFNDSHLKIVISFNPLFLYPELFDKTY